MTRQQWLFTQLMSEACEVAHAVSKILMFGPNDHYPGYGHNMERLKAELNDMKATITLLQREKAVPYTIDDQAQMNAKLDKIQVMYQYAKERGEVM